MAASRVFAHDMHHTQPGGPARAAAAIETALDAKVTPLRLALGSDAVAPSGAMRKPCWPTWRHGSRFHGEPASDAVTSPV